MTLRPSWVTGEALAGACIRAVPVCEDYRRWWRRSLTELVALPTDDLEVIWSSLQVRADMAAQLQTNRGSLWHQRARLRCDHWPCPGNCRQDVWRAERRRYGARSKEISAIQYLSAAWVFWRPRNDGQRQTEPRVTARVSRRCRRVRY